mgnify:CR=1 FL=1
MIATYDDFYCKPDLTIKDVYAELICVVSAYRKLSKIERDLRRGKILRIAELVSKLTPPNTNLDLEGLSDALGFLESEGITINST